MNKTIYIGCAVWLVVILSGVNAISSERLINIPREMRAERIGDIHMIRMPDGTRLEIGRMTIKDGPIADNIIGEVEMKHYDPAGKLQEGKGYIIVNPAEGRLVGDAVKMPVTIKFIPK